MEASSRLRVLVVSSVVPDECGSGGPIVLHRYLKLNPGIEAEVLSWDAIPFRLKILGKLRQFGWVKTSTFLECLWPVLPSLRMVRKKIDAFHPDVILTVAHGYWHIQATAAAKEFQLPLVVFFQDWWPEFSEVPPWFRQKVTRQLMRTRASSSVSICVSEGMRQILGGHSNCVLIHDIPSKTETAAWDPQSNDILRVVYFGNLVEYGPPIEQALLALEDSIVAKLEVYGPKPFWSSGNEERFRKSGHYHGRLAPDELLKVLREFQAVLVVMSFSPAMKWRMSSSFPSKLIEGMQLGLPIVIWGPEYCSAIMWARKGGRALCVTDPNPEALRQALEQLACNRGDQQRLADASRQAAQTIFNPDRIQAQFLAALQNAVANSKASADIAL